MSGAPWPGPTPEERRRKYSDTFFNVFVTSSLLEAYDLHDLKQLSLEKGWESGEYDSRIEKAKDTHRDALGIVLRENNDERGLFPLPEGYDSEKLREAVGRSDFDWNDRKKIAEYREWFFGKP